VPALNRVLDEATRIVRDPATGLTLAAAARDRRTRRSGAAPTGTIRDVVDNEIGGGSDYTVFLNHLGIPIADLSFEGPYGVYHSIYDTPLWVERFGDPGFRYHVAMVQLWGIVAIRLASADVVPLDYDAYVREVEGFLAALERRRLHQPSVRPMEDLAAVRAALTALRSAAGQLAAARDAALGLPADGVFAGLDERLIAAERGFLDPEGLPGRPWYRHLIYAPAFTYAPELLPGIARAADEEDGDRARAQSNRLAAAIERVAAALAGRAD
jgi:N-acetylated-alpha-linked acidic dipeptidase